jgi:hypothetical protein
LGDAAAMSDEVKGLLSKPKGLLDEYLTEDEEAEELKKTVRTLRRWRKMRMGPAYTHNGKDVLYRHDWNREWLEAGKRQMPRARAERTSKRSEAIARRRPA